MKKILVFEDDYHQAERLKKKLGKMGFKVEVVDSLPQYPNDQAFTSLLARSSEFALIIWDGEIFNIMSTDGFIQEFKTVFSGPMIAHSASDQTCSLQVEVGCTHSIQKDIDNDLFDLIQTLLS